MRYYEQKYPEVDELVMVQVRQIAEMGAYVKLVRFLHACQRYEAALNLSSKLLFFSLSLIVPKTPNHGLDAKLWRPDIVGVRQHRGHDLAL